MLIAACTSRDKDSGVDSQDGARSDSSTAAGIFSQSDAGGQRGRERGLAQSLPS